MENQFYVLKTWHKTLTWKSEMGHIPVRRDRKAKSLNLEQKSERKVLFLFYAESVWL